MSLSAEQIPLPRERVSTLARTRSSDRPGRAETRRSRVPLIDIWKASVARRQRGGVFGVHRPTQHVGVTGGCHGHVGGLACERL